MKRLCMFVAALALVVASFEFAEAGCRRNRCCVRPAQCCVPCCPPRRSCCCTCCCVSNCCCPSMIVQPASYGADAVTPTPVGDVIYESDGSGAVMEDAVIESSSDVQGGVNASDVVPVEAPDVPDAPSEDGGEG